MTILLSDTQGQVYLGPIKHNTNPISMKKREKVNNVMTTELVTINVNDSLHNANNLFSSQEIRHLPVVANDQLVGILSQTDILRISFGNTFGEQDGGDEAIFDMLSINQIMKHSPTTVDSNESIKDAARILAENEFHALPVVEDDQLVGIITTTDIMKYFIDNC